MTKKEIQRRMIEAIQNAIRDIAIERILDNIDEDTVDEFMWANDYGVDFVDMYIEENEERITEELLTEIYNEIDIYDITEPW